MSKRKLTILILSIIMIVAGQTIAKPELTIKTTQFDFGYAPYNTKISHSFWLYSTGDETVEIEKVITGCGCTKAPLTKNIIPPGDSALLEIIFNTNKYKNRVVKSPKIISNAAEKKVSIITNVLKEPNQTIPVVIEPDVIDLSLPEYTNSQKINFTIINNSAKRLKPSLIDYPDDLFDLKLPKKIGAGKTVKGTLIIKSNESFNKIQKSFTIELNDENKTRLTIPIKKSGPKQLSLKK
ncbi:MAG: DUF1573 domain-containing protein [candidate division Zixibacteria bacterium]|nr:DUF1573 domain-containing protein [candidate division Zixibacteria bacterium]